ncbi:MAG: glycosyltransferase family 2 protein, partial [Pirellulales bacterium]
MGITSRYGPARPTLDEALISVVLPTYNEQDVLGRLAEQIMDTLDECRVDWELVFVNDGSTDGTAEVLDAMAAGDDRVRVLHFSRNFGQQAAVQAGLARARGDAVVLMDADMQDAPSAIPRFLQQWQDGADVVYAVRRHRKERLLKRLAFAAFHRLMAWTASVRIPVDAGNFGLVDRRVLDRLLTMPEHDRYFPGLRSWVGFHQAGVEVERGERYDHRPRVSLRGLVRLAKTALFSFSAFPLTLFHAIGAAASAVFVVSAAYALGARLLTDWAVPGWTSYV